MDLVLKLLIQAWRSAGSDGRETPCLLALELEISQFEQPAQLAFAELNRLDQTGRLAGMDPGRLQALIQEEEAITARYGENPFRHIAALEPAGVLTERRFTLAEGISRPRKSP